MPNHNHNHNNTNKSWSNVLCEGAVKSNKLFESKLQTLAVIDGDAKSPFDYSVRPVSLTVVEKFLPKDYHYSAQKVAWKQSNAFMRRHEILNQMKSIDYHLRLFNAAYVKLIGCP